MSEPTQDPPFITVKEGEDGQLGIQTNVPPQLKPVMLWMLEQAKLMLLTGQMAEGEQKRILPGNGFAAGMMRRIHGR